MFERGSVVLRPRDDEPGDYLYAHPAGLALAVASGVATAGLVVLLGAWLATPLVASVLRRHSSPPSVWRWRC